MRKVSDKMSENAEYKTTFTNCNVTVVIVGKNGAINGFTKYKGKKVYVVVPNEYEVK